MAGVGAQGTDGGVVVRLVLRLKRAAAFHDEIGDSVATGAGKACAIRLVAAAVLASCGSSAGLVSCGSACVNVRSRFAITAAATQAATTSRLVSRGDLR